MANKIVWRWIADCGLCKWESRWHRRQWVVRLLAVWHTTTRHPYSHMRIAACDEETLWLNKVERAALAAGEET